MSDAGEERRPELPIELDGTAFLFNTLRQQVKLLRTKCGMSQKALGEAVNNSEDLISSIERGVRATQPDFLERVDDALDAGGILKVAMDDVEKALAQARKRHPDWFRAFADAEATAVALHDYGVHSVPGLLQTEEYARALFTNWRPLLSEEIIEKRVADRMARQEILEKWPARTFTFLLEEALLHRPIGGPEVYKQQLRRLLEVGQLRNVVLQVVPISCADHACLDGAFTLLTPKGRRQVAYLEAHGYPKLITEQEEVRIFSERYGIMRSRALRPAQSLSLIKKLLGEQ
ncbi:helix-turn-helix domain-containing protein [Streptomyces jumonjinensis]|uniref:Helix-turn-helix domain-containing protein n=1 Tax=Streptomyces jumonjinensis TaxID=1945 RepID=A0A646KGF3_STRJU|nr:helix-turn-helix transcriptional regulator [Streptomyces jumonjinensis]MQT01294.1 helix-turn-helix domain-containing protein [Streptomyces jumonjinensis]